jgi:hypothetical protein
MPQFQAPANHPSNEIVGAGCSDGYSALTFPILEDGDAISDLKNLWQPM